tara:strand:- start:172 stop:414 length:243 start_codon:yes stop_codon:yes gene_type:complete
MMGSIQWTTIGNPLNGVILKLGDIRYAMFKHPNHVVGAEQLLFTTREGCVKFWTHYGFKIQSEDSNVISHGDWYVRKVIV